LPTRLGARCPIGRGSDADVFVAAASAHRSAARAWLLALDAASTASLPRRDVESLIASTASLPVPAALKAARCRGVTAI
jgi:hypothetical protein